jgi:hypothetical protein
MGIDWKRKLSSRKFWTALGALFAAVAVVCGAGESVITEVSAIISAAGVLVAYILGESMVDAAAGGEKEKDL